jgi:hypothetical protein
MHGFDLLHVIPFLSSTCHQEKIYMARTERKCTESFIDFVSNTVKIQPDAAIILFSGGDDWGTSEAHYKKKV